MREDEMNEFSWSMLFIVTACSSFIFNLLIKIMDGHFSNLLLKVGSIATLLAALNWAISRIAKQSLKKSCCQNRAVLKIYFQ